MTKHIFVLSAIIWYENCNICFLSAVCTAPLEPVTIKENNTVDTLVVHINTTTKDVTLNLTENPGNAFDLRGSQLIAKKGLDFDVCLFHDFPVSNANLSKKTMMTLLENPAKTSFRW